MSLTYHKNPLRLAWLVCFLPLISYGATLTTNGSAADVQAKITAANAGDTVTVPAGTFTWASTVSLNKSVTLKGNGVGSTIIRDNVQSQTSPVLSVNYKDLPNGRPRVTGIEFQDGGRVTGPSAPNGVIKITGSNTNGGAARIDHCKFYHLNGHVGTETAIGSVIDHCEFFFEGNTYIFVYASNYDGGSNGDKSWAADSGVGGPNFLFIEDCLIQNDDHYYASVDCFGGGRYVMRKCKWVNTHPGGHGTEGQRARGVRVTEIYDNIGTHNLGGIIGNVRGGVQIYHGNTVTGVTTWGIRLQCQRIDKSFNIWGQATGNNKYDRNKNGVVELAIDQPGAGKGGLLSGGNPPVLPAGWNDQVVDPCYAWNNTFNGQPARMYGEQYNIKDGIHYFNSPKPGYTPYTYPHPLVSGGPLPSPAPSPTATATATATTTPTETPTPEPVPTETPEPTPDPTVEPSPTPIHTPIIMILQPGDSLHISVPNPTP